jgi:hypothetical protein
MLLSGDDGLIPDENATPMSPAEVREHLFIMENMAKVGLMTAIVSMPIVIIQTRIWVIVFSFGISLIVAGPLIQMIYNDVHDYVGKHFKEKHGLI